MVAVWVVAAVYAMKMFVEWDMTCVEVVSVCGETRSAA